MRKVQLLVLKVKNKNNRKDKGFNYLLRIIGNLFGILLGIKELITLERKIKIAI